MLAPPTGSRKDKDGKEGSEVQKDKPLKKQASCVKLCVAFSGGKTIDVLRLVTPILCAGLNEERLLQEEEGIGTASCCRVKLVDHNS